MGEMNPKDLLIRIKPSKILLLLREEREWYISELARESGVTYAYTDKVVDVLERCNLVRKTRAGRKVSVQLTSEGVQIANLLEELTTRLEQVKMKPEEQIDESMEKG